MGKSRKRNELIKTQGLPNYYPKNKVQDNLFFDRYSETKFAIASKMWKSIGPFSGNCRIEAESTRNEEELKRQQNDWKKMNSGKT